MAQVELLTHVFNNLLTQANIIPYIFHHAFVWQLATAS